LYLLRLGPEWEGYPIRTWVLDTRNRNCILYRMSAAIRIRSRQSSVCWSCSMLGCWDLLGVKLSLGWKFLRCHGRSFGEKGVDILSCRWLLGYRRTWIFGGGWLLHTHLRWHFKSQVRRSCNWHERCVAWWWVSWDRKVSVEYFWLMDAFG
jgi:hypothetical protein